MHHERFDGKGYPFGLTGDRIDTFASIVAIADVYDALTSDRCYRSAVCPFEVIALFESNGLTGIQPQIHPDLFGTYRPDLCRQLCPSERWQSGQDQHDRHKKTSPPSHPIRKRRICRSVQTSGSLCRRDHLIK